jgi:hypothetical protein
MDKDRMYRQCSLSRTLESGAIERHVAYIPNERAKVGKILDLKFGEELRKGWRVDEVGPCRELSDLDLAHGDHKRFEWVLGN